MTRRTVTPRGASAGRAAHPGHVSPPQPRPARPISEHALQAQVAAYLAAALPPNAWWSSIDHAGTSARRGAMLKARGVRKGLPDMVIFYLGRCLWIELKAKRGAITSAQRDFMVHAEIAGCGFALCRSLADVEAALRYYHIPVLCKVMA